MISKGNLYTHLASLPSGSGRGWRTLHPFWCERQIHSGLPPSAHDETAGPASATGDSRLHEEGLFCVRPADVHLKTLNTQPECHVNYSSAFDFKCLSVCGKVPVLCVEDVSFSTRFQSKQLFCCRCYSFISATLQWVDVFLGKKKKIFCYIP